MSSVVEFLRLIWPDDGNKALLAVNSKTKKSKSHVWFTSSNETAIAQCVRSWLSQQLEIYFSVGAFVTKFRRQEQSLGLRAFFIDVDIGPKTPYPTTKEAVVDLQLWCRNVQLPPPSALVSSGGGLHVYWATDEVIPANEWERIASGMVEKFKVGPLSVKDQGLSANSACILRLPDTANFKEPIPRPVKILSLTKRYPAQLFRQLFLPANGISTDPTLMVIPPHITESALTATLADIGTKPKLWSVIKKRIQLGTGCEQIRLCWEYQDKTGEVLWFLTVGVVKFCIDGDLAIHEVSCKHPQYDKQQTIAKASRFTGPPTCATFDRERPGICVNCPHYGRLKTPLMLGISQEEGAAPQKPTEDMVPPVQPTAPGMPTPIEWILRNELPASLADRSPFPYKTCVDGKTYKVITDPAEVIDLTKKGVQLVLVGNEQAICVYPGVIELLGRAFDEEANEEMLQLTFQLKGQQKRYATLNSREVGSLDQLRKAFVGGAIMNTKDANFVQDFVRSAQRQDNRPSATLRTKMGWTNDKRSFVYGKYVINKDSSVDAAMLAGVIQDVANNLHVRGNPAHWIRMADYWNQPKFTPMAFTVLSAFGAPLMNLLDIGVHGGLIHLFSPESGFGKTAVQTMISAVYGDPKRLIFSPQDTTNATLHKVGQLSHMPICIDEITNQDAKRVSDLVYQVTQGREKMRMRGDYSGNVKTSGDWATCVVTSGNASITDKLFSLKASPEGELMRFLELRPTERLDGPTPLSALMSGVDDNYGGIGAMYLYYITNNRAKVLTVLSTIKKKLQQSPSLGESQRFWLALLTCNLAGGYIARELGFIKYDLQAIEEWALDFVGRRLKEIDKRGVKPHSALQDFLGALSSATVLVPESGIVTPPKFAPLARMDYQSGILSVSLRALTDETTRLQIALYDVTRGLVSPHLTYLDEKVVDLTEGVPNNLITSVNISCVRYRVTNAVRSGNTEKVVNIR